MRELIKELRNMGKTVMVSSHILPELADICNKIGIIERGQLLFDGDVESAIRQVRQHVVYFVAVANEMNPAAKDHLEGHIDVLSVEDKPDQGYLRVTLNDGVTDGSFIAEVLMKNGLRLKMLKEEEIDLEDVFMGITKGITN
jgi:ABC-2 type transport system ATP-binding protein